MRALLFVSLILVSYTDIYGQWLAGYTYRRRIDIHESMIPGISSFSNFPVLIDITNDDFRECPTGYITNHNGWDIRFTASNGTSTLDHDLESYDPVTGRIRAWVRVTVLSATVDTRIYIYFGNQSITTNSSSSATWEVAYRGVWHLNGNLNDATSPSNPGINHGTSDASGFIANGRDFDASASEYIEVPYDNTLDLTQSVTVSAWVRLSANSFDQKIFGNQNDSRGGYKLGIFSDNKVEFETRNNGNDANPLIKSVAGGTVLSTGTWYYVAGVYSDAGDFIRTYVNGNLDRSLSGANSLATTTSGSAAMGRESFASSLFFDGVIDELRVQRTERSADWITAEYNNQSSPATFYTVLDTESAIPVAICKKHFSFTRRIRQRNTYRAYG